MSEINILGWIKSVNVAGAGKTTLLNVLTGTTPRTCGHVTLNGEPLDRRWRRKMAYVMQKDAFYASLTLRETLTVKLTLHVYRVQQQQQQQQQQQILLLLLLISGRCTVCLKNFYSAD